MLKVSAFYPEKQKFYSWKKYFLSGCQYQNKKALFTDPIFSEGFDYRDKTSEVSAVVSGQVSKVVSKQGPLSDTATFGHSKSSPTTLSKSPKGHLISKRPFDVYKLTHKQQKFRKDFCPSL